MIRHEASKYRTDSLGHNWRALQRVGMFNETNGTANSGPEIRVIGGKDYTVSAGVISRANGDYGQRR